MRKAHVIKSFADEYKKLLKNTVFIYLDSHWFVSRDDHGVALYVIRIKNGYEDIEYKIQSFGSDFEVVTDIDEITTLLIKIHELFSHVDESLLARFNESDEKDSNIFPKVDLIENIELDDEGTFKVKLLS